ncbi:hypothetical protein JTB14_005952 [Gonioctena quinquepunctata]|nr:hypothetical protein JTB14_005952 [Gonioctena quinquepunctata]
MRKKCQLRRKMYESSCSYQGALELKRSASTTCPLGIKTEDFGTAADWPTYRFCNPSTFEQLKQSVEKAKAALQDRSGFFGNSSAFSDLYNVSTGRSQDNIQDSSSRLRDSSDNDIKRSEPFPCNQLLVYFLYSCCWKICRDGNIRRRRVNSVGPTKHRRSNKIRAGVAMATPSLHPAILHSQEFEKLKRNILYRWVPTIAEMLLEEIGVFVIKVHCFSLSQQWVYCHLDDIGYCHGQRSDEPFCNAFYERGNGEWFNFIEGFPVSSCHLFIKMNYLSSHFERVNNIDGYQ